MESPQAIFNESHRVALEAIREIDPKRFISLRLASEVILSSASNRECFPSARQASEIAAAALLRIGALMQGDKERTLLQILDVLVPIFEQIISALPQSEDKTPA